MFSMMFSGISAAIGFVLSILIGILSRAAMPMLIVRAIVFAFLFFIISALARMLLSHFLPELLETDGAGHGNTHLGSKIDITDEGSDVFSHDDSAGGSPDGPSFMGVKPDDSEEDLGDISQIAQQDNSGSNGGDTNSGIDQNAENSYNSEGGLIDLSDASLSGMLGKNLPFVASPAAGRAVKSEQARPPDESRAASIGTGVARKSESVSSDEALPDLDSMAGAFMSSSPLEEMDDTGFSVSVPSKKSSSSNTPGWADDFDGRELAMGIRSVLNKEKEG